MLIKSKLQLACAFSLTVLVLLFIATQATKAEGGSFGGGDGSSEDPYLVEDVEDLQNMSANLSAHYKLVNDIEANATSGWNGDSGFNPIGDDTNRISGSLNGQEFTIFNLTIDRSAEYYVGLFGYIGSEASVSNLSLVGTNITGGYYVGGIVGYSEGTVNYAANNGNVTGDYGVGGIAGYSYGIIKNSMNYGDVTASIDFVGGIAGRSKGIIYDVTNHANVTGSDDFIGGVEKKGVRYSY